MWHIIIFGKHQIQWKDKAHNFIHFLNDIQLHSNSLLKLQIREQQRLKSLDCLLNEKIVEV